MASGIITIDMSIYALIGSLFPASLDFNFENEFKLNEELTITRTRPEPICHGRSRVKQTYAILSC